MEHGMKKKPRGTFWITDEGKNRVKLTGAIRLHDKIVQLRHYERTQNRDIISKLKDDIGFGILRQFKTNFPYLIGDCGRERYLLNREHVTNAEVNGKQQIGKENICNHRNRTINISFWKKPLRL